jgi:hypothetical protein
MSDNTQTHDDPNADDSELIPPSCSVPIEWLQERAAFYCMRAEERPHEFGEYRRMAWACRFVPEIWREWIADQELQNAPLIHAPERQTETER